MIDHEFIIAQIKSDLLGLWNDSNAAYSYTQWFGAASLILEKYFGIKKSDFFIFDNGKSSFIQLEGHQSLAKENIAIPSGLIERNPTQSSHVYLELFQKEGFEYADEVIVFNNDKSERLALLLLESTDEWQAFSTSPYLEEFKNAISNLIRMVEKINFLESREKRFRQLFKVAELFNSTMSSQVILEGIMNSVTESFPSFEINLLLSHDQKELTHSYQLFDYMNERSSTIEAFVSGDVTIEEATDLSANLFNAPIKGRQGIYGVLQINTPSDYVFSTAQSNFIRMLAKTAGSALENASLYDQSHRLIEDLQLVNETSRKLNSNMQLSEMIAYVKQQLFKAIHPNEIAFVLNKEGEVPYNLLKESTDFFRTTNGEEYIHFVSDHLKSGKESLFDAKFSTTVNKSVRYEAVIGVPITNQEEIVGFIICVHRIPYSFSFENFKLIRLLIGHSSLALANSMLRDQLQGLVNKDHLTKLYARRYLDDVVEKSIEQNDGGTLLLLDIDNFKLVNDTYGHSVGDDVLKGIASLVLSVVKEKGVAARWGGEEFAVYLPLISVSEAEEIAQQLVRKIPTASTPSVTVSAGMASWQVGQEMMLNDLFQFTDAALYEAKSNGKNQVVIHGTSLSNS